MMSDDPSSDVEGMPLLVMQTTWPAIRIALYRRRDGRYQYFEQFLRDEGWVSNEKSGLYADEHNAIVGMARYAEEYEET